MQSLGNPLERVEPLYPSQDCRNLAQIDEEADPRQEALSSLHTSALTQRRSSGTGCTGLTEVSPLRLDGRRKLGGSSTGLAPTVTMAD